MSYTLVTILLSTFIACPGEQSYKAQNVHVLENIKTEELCLKMKKDDIANYGSTILVSSTCYLKVNK